MHGSWRVSWTHLPLSINTQRIARRNAYAAALECAARRRERDEVDRDLEELAEQRLARARAL